MNKNKILIVDDEEAICKLVQSILQDEGYDVDYKTTFASAIDSFKSNTYDLCILDVWLHDSSEDGILLMEQCLEINSNIPIIMMSGHSTVETAVNAIKKGAYDFIEKPFKTDRLLVMVQRALELYSLKNENKTLKSGDGKTNQIIDLPLLSGNSQAFTNFHRELLQAAKSSSPVMLFGEFGTGKKTAAKFIHNESSRKDNQCAVILCDCETVEDIESKLFGAEKSENLLLKIKEGTLVLDQITSLPISTQKKLLSYLENSTPVKNGAVRIICTYSTNIDILIEKGSFIKDLFYALNVLSINIPKLQNRQEDIILLIDRLYIGFKNSNTGISNKVSGDAKALLSSYKWPGNIKQLKNFTEWLIVSGVDQRKEISLLDVSAYLSDAHVENSSNVNDNEPSFDECMDFPLKHAREIFEKVYLQEQLVRFNYNISKASGFIGMERSALHRKLKSLDIQTSAEIINKKVRREG